MSTSPEQRPRAARIGRKMGWGVSLGITAVASVWSFISVLAVHCGFSGEKPVVVGWRITPSADKPAELRRCHRYVAGLLRDLHKESYDLQARSLKFDIDTAAEWRNWSAAWGRRWTAVGRRCRLKELSGTGKSPTIDAPNDVHQELDRLRHAYDGVMARYVEHHARRLKRLRRTLTSIRNTIDRRSHRKGAGRPPLLPPGSGAKK